ncbi:MAG: peptidoglycan editing factor PgeF [Chlorobiaceae bacterium]|nr:peptidoglycan editing factor PgeF [Chlorobiaceae bacterium]
MANKEHPLLLAPEIFRSFPGLVAVQSSRKGGVSAPPFDSLNLGLNTDDDPANVKENHRRLCSRLGIPVESLILTRQVHGTEVCRIHRPGHVEGFDALITDAPGIYLAIGTADCYPVLIHDPEHRASGAVHAGWQGTVGQIVIKTLRAMAKEFGTRPDACTAWVGTGISGENYEIGAEIAGRFDERYLKPSPGGETKSLLDLSAANRDQLLEAGVPACQIECSPLCSSGDRDLFFSYRRDHGRTGRMLSIIGVRACR